MDVMRRLFLASALILLITGVYGYTSSTVPIQAEAQQQQACNGLEVGEVDYNTSVEDRTLNFKGVFCAPNIGYAMEESSINVEDDTVNAYARISTPEGVTGPAITPVRFSESRELSPGSYDLETRIEVEGRHNISDSSEIEIEGENRTFMQRIRAFLSGLFG